MIKRYKISDESEVFCMPIEQRGNKRESEINAENALLQHIFGKDIELKHTDEGKPYIENKNTDENGVFLSISHSRTHLAVAVSKKEIGVDIENISDRLQRVKDKYLSKKEQKGMTMTLENLCKCWCAKEAIFKTAGKKAGYLGEEIEIFTDEIGENCSFDAQIIPTKEKYKLTIVEQNEQYIIVVAWAY